MIELTDEQLQIIADKVAEKLAKEEFQLLLLSSITALKKVMQQQSVGKN